MLKPYDLLRPRSINLSIRFSQVSFIHGGLGAHKKSLLIFLFCLAIIKLFSSRRVTDEALKKQALYTAGLLAQVLSGHLVWPDAGKTLCSSMSQLYVLFKLIKCAPTCISSLDNPSSNFAYLTVCLNTASQLLTDERGNRTTLNSLILSPFFDSGGL
jgi:hypothetical protein